MVRFLDVASPYGGRKAVHRGVRARDRLVNVAELDGGQHRTEDLLARDRHVRRHTGEDRRLHEVAFAGSDVRPRTASDEPGAFLLGDVYVAQHALELTL